MSPIVERLTALIAEHGWKPAFVAAIEHARRQQVASLSHIETLDDYLRFIDDMVHWAPRESGDSLMVHDKLVEFYFILDRPPLRRLQSAVEPGPPSASLLSSPLTPLSTWIADYASAWGAYLDTPASARHVESFRTNPAFHWDDYMPPPSGYLTFNQFFARHVKPGARPVAQSESTAVVVSPADAVFIGQWPISADSKIDVKGMRWSIAQLLDGSPHAERFAGGTFMHSALRTFDYHRFHTPVAGTVIEARIVQGQAFLDVTAVAADGGGMKLHAVEGTGYQFVQMRGLVVLESPLGLVACLPVGMGQVSSVVLTAEVGRQLRKGEELGYFQFGGSDFVMLFEKTLHLALTCQQDVHCLQGAEVGRVDGRPRQFMQATADPRASPPGFAARR